MAFKNILPLLALVGTAIAQCSGPSITIRSQEDATGLSSCTRYNGDIIIDSTVSGSISIDGVRSISGNLECIGAEDLNSISASQLSEIGGEFHLDGLIVLSTLSFSSLTGVNRVNWINLPNLQALNFPQGLRRANSIYISNTQLNTLEGIELEGIGSMNVNNNPYLNTINVNSLTNVTSALAFSANGRDLAISFPNLENAGNLTFRDLAAVDMPSLATVPGSMGFYTDSFANFSAPNLTSIGAALAFVDCPNMIDISFPSLTRLGGGFLLANNSALKTVTGFPMLRSIGGAIDFAGSFDRIAFQSLQQVTGAARVETSSTNTSVCDVFNNAKKASAIRGNVNCRTNVDDPQINGTGNGGSSENAATGFAAASSALATGAFGLVAALLIL